MVEINIQKVECRDDFGLKGFGNKGRRWSDSRKFDNTDLGAFPIALSS